jgi:hypothetical protein
MTALLLSLSALAGDRLFIETESCDCLEVYDASSGSYLGEVVSGLGGTVDAAVTPGGRWLVAQSSPGDFTLVSTASLAEFTSPDNSPAGSFDIALHPSRGLAYVATYTANMPMQDLAAVGTVGYLGLSGRITAASVTRAGDAVFAFDDASGLLVEHAGGTTATRATLDFFVEELHVDPTDSYVLAVGSDEIAIYDRGTGRTITEKLNATTYGGVVFTASGFLLATDSYLEQAIYSPSTGTIRLLSDHNPAALIGGKGIRDIAGTQSSHYVLYDDRIVHYSASSALGTIRLSDGLRYRIVVAPQTPSSDYKPLLPSLAGLIQASEELKLETPWKWSGWDLCADCDASAIKEEYSRALEALEGLSALGVSDVVDFLSQSEPELWDLGGTSLKKLTGEQLAALTMGEAPDQDAANALLDDLLVVPE